MTSEHHHGQHDHTATTWPSWKPDTTTAQTWWSPATTTASPTTTTTRRPTQAPMRPTATRPPTTDSGEDVNNISKVFSSTLFASLDKKNVVKI